MNPVVVAVVFGLTFVAELPDKSLFASLVLGTRYPALPVWTGVAAAFALHVVIAVTAGGLLTLLPRRVVEGIVAALFLTGAAIMLVGSKGEEPARSAGGAAPRVPPTFGRVALTSFGVVFVGEWGDITQITTANYAAKYDDPLSVALGALLALWVVAGLAIALGNNVLRYVPVSLARRVAGVVLLGFAIASAVTVIRS